MSEHKFRYLLPPGTNFQFVSKFKTWIWLSIFLTAATIAILIVNKEVRGEYMNWTIDFKGGTEVILAFKDKNGAFTRVDPATVRDVFHKAKEEGVELSDIDFDEQTAKGEEKVHALMVRSPKASALSPAAEQKARDGFVAKFADREVAKASWSGDRLFVRSRKPIKNEEAAPAFAAAGLEHKPWPDKEVELYSTPDQSTGEYHSVFSMWGLDRQYIQLLAKELPGQVQPVSMGSYTVGAKAGAELRNDAAKSIL